VSDNTALKNAADIEPTYIPYYNSTQKVIAVNGLQYDGMPVDIRRSGTYAQKPATTYLKVGFKYFATDKGTAGVGASIYYTGDNTTPWVYADGTAVS
jgi:hypothetical protein